MAGVERILYGLPISVYSCKLRLALALKEIDLPETPPPGGYASATYRALVPQGTIPALVEGDFVLTESDAIVEYLDETGIGRPLLPREPRARARARALSRLVDTRLEPAVRALFPLVGAGQPVPEAARNAILRPLEMLEKLAGDGPFLSGFSHPGLPDCGLWAVGAVLGTLDEVLGLHLPQPALIRAGDGVPATAPHLATYRAVLADWAAQKTGAA
ncbi:glutathione S-transferase family protein [Nioella sp. MMSF_3534]|uniref:glutathione S-transferase family protein n=1 Tax=Nioella sp. MMSF_3534 TaxID=3046720 RepID=UPI00273F051D|nr:glutathione S-transferase family protein [Nioella sp. MMSF_3534]